MNITINDVTTYYEVKGSGIPVLILHGWGVDHGIMAGCMEPVFRSMHGDFKRIYVDLPGMVSSTISGSIRSADDLRDFLYAFVRLVIPGERYAIAGKSYGGYLARALAGKDAEHVVGLLLLCPLVSCETQERNSPPRCVRERDKNIEEFVPPEELENFSLFHTIQTKETWDRYRTNIIPGAKRADQKFLGEVLALRRAFSEDIDAGDRAYAFPALLLAGRQDWCVGYADLWSLVERYPRASFAVLDRAAHNLEFEQRGLFTLHATQWLSDVARFASEP